MYAFTVNSTAMHSDSITWLWWVLPVAQNGVGLASKYWIPNKPVLMKYIWTEWGQSRDW